MKKVDESVRAKLMSSENQSQSSRGALQNRLSAKQERFSETEDNPAIVRHGYGVQYWTDGAHYEGQWSYNKAEGQGTFWHAEGDIYRGEFKNDMANGYGEYTHINGSKYKGEFRDDV